MAIKFIYFDVANTLLHKPKLWANMHDVLLDHGYNINVDQLEKRHKILSEVIDFPIKTSREFYRHFNQQFLMSFGVVANDELLDKIYSACSGLSWKPFSDTHILNDIKAPKGILSNWDTSLRKKIKSYFDLEFEQFAISGELNVSKPNLEIFNIARQLLPHLSCEEIVFVGDSIKLDTLPGQKAGMRTILIDRLNLYEGYPGSRIQNLEELTKL